MAAVGGLCWSRLLRLPGDDQQQTPPNFFFPAEDSNLLVFTAFYHRKHKSSERVVTLTAVANTPPRPQSEV